jgi:PAS domain S-box-containing protein
MENAEAIHVQPNSRTTTGPATAWRFSGCILPVMASSGQGSERLNAQLLVDSIPALIHTARPDGYLDYFNKPWLEYLGVTLDKATGWNWTAFVHPEDVEGIVAKWRACLATGEVFEYETRVRGANGEYRWMFHRKVPLRDANGNIVKWYGSSLDIEERKTAEEQLRRNTEELQRSEFYLAKGQRLAHMGSWAFDPDGFYYWSPELFRMHGLDPASKPPSVQEYLDRVHPHDRESMANLIKGILAKASTFDATKRIVRPNGEVRYIRCVGAPVVENQSLKKYVGSAIDVTEHELLTQELQRREAYLAEAQRLSHTGSFGWKPDTDEIVWSDETYRIFEYDGCVKPTIDSVVQRVHPEDRADFKEVINRALAGATDFEHAYRLLLPDGRVKHVHAIAHVLENASGNCEFVGSVTDITERKAAEEAHRSSEAYLAEAQRLSHTGSWAWNAATFEPSYWSEECYRVLGYDRAEPLPLLETFFQRIIPEERAAIREQFDRAIRDKADFELDLRFVHPITGIRNIRSTGHAVLDRCGDLREIVGTVIDITDRKRAEDEQRHAEAVIRQQEAELRDVLDSIPSMVWSALPDGSNTYVNSRWVTYSGLPAEQMGGSGWHAVTNPDDLERHNAKWLACVASGEPFEDEVRFRRADGQYRWHLQRGIPLRDEAGNIVKWYGVLTDIEDRKRAEESLRSSEAYLAEAQRLSQTGSWAWSPDQDIRYWSEECYRVLSFDPQDGLPRFEEFFQRIHSDDQPGFRELIQTAIREKAEWEADYRIVHPGGAIRDIHIVGHPVLSTSGHLVEFVGTVIDVTARKQAEEELRRSEMELRQMLDFTPQLVVVFGPNRERLCINRIALDYLGTSLDEWRQRSFAAEVHPDDSERLKTYADRALSSGAAYELEVRLRKADGSYRWFLARYNPVRDNKGQVMRWYVACTDIEDRKQAEDTLRRENVALREEIDKASMFEEIVGTSRPLQTVLSRISKVAPSNSTVLITGETGTGKELVARAIHRRSDRSSRAFVSANCAAIPRDLIASELFGHEKGAFTGATQQRLGRFELASGGTLFLDEVGELPAETQIALLRVLQEHEFERVGGSRPIRADVRVIAATNRDLQAAISAGSFRSDLFYRLHVFPVEIPSLRERKEDIPLLVEYFIDRYARKAGKHFRSVEKRTLQVLQSYPWPGNIRELQNVIERSVIVCETASFSVDESWLSQELPGRKAESQLYLSEKVATQEKEIIEAALRECQGRVFGPSGAAAKLGIARSTLESKIRSLKIDKKRFKT